MTIEFCNLTEKLANKLLPGFLMCNSAISTTYDVKTTKLKESLSFCNWEWPSKRELRFGILWLDGKGGRWRLLRVRF